MMRPILLPAGEGGRRPDEGELMALPEPKPDKRLDFSLTPTLYRRERALNRLTVRPISDILAPRGRVALPRTV